LVWPLLIELWVVWLRVMVIVWVLQLGIGWYGMCICVGCLEETEVFRVVLVFGVGVGKRCYGLVVLRATVKLAFQTMVSQICLEI
jgi:hypothetical protein